MIYLGNRVELDETVKVRIGSVRIVR